MKSIFLLFISLVFVGLPINNISANGGDLDFGDCGNDVLDSFEMCDGSDFGTNSCENQGFSGGILTCSPDCQFISTGQCLDSEPGTVLRLDFNGYGPNGNGHTADGYLPVRFDQLKSATNSYGWDIAPWYFERIEGKKFLSASVLERLQYDGQFAPYSESRIFTIDVKAGHAYQLTILTGDTTWNHDRQRFTVTDPNGTTSVNQLVSTISGTPDGATLKYVPGEQVITGGNGAAYGTVRLVTDIIEPTVSGGENGQIKLNVKDEGGGDPSAVIIGLDVRPLINVIPINIEPVGPAEGLRDADGVSIDTYRATGAPANTIMTVKATNGVNTLLVGPDNNAPWFGGQIMSDENGEFTFTITRPARDLPVTITAMEYMGSAYGIYVQNYKTGIRFDFGNYNSPVAQAFLPMYPQIVFNEKRGYGWINRVASGDRRDPNIGPLGTDYNSGGDGTFRMSLDMGTYSLRLTHCNPQYYGKVSYATNTFSVSAETAKLYTIPNIPAGTCVEMNEDVVVTDGFLDLRLYDGSFMISGLEVFEKEETEFNPE